MSSIEKDLKKRIRATPLQKTILNAVAGAGILGVALLAPNALQMFKPFLRSKKPRDSINASVYRLIQAGMLREGQGGYRETYFLTHQGEKFLQKMRENKYQFKKPKRWDGRFRLLIFDIPETKRGSRDSLRRELINIGFLQLQRSVWVYPYACEDLMNLLRTDFEIGEDVLYIVTEKIEDNNRLKDYFNLT